MATSIDPSKRNSKQPIQNRSSRSHRLTSPHIPARLQLGEDAQDDVTAPDRGNQVRSQYMHQSIFSMITAAGSRADFNTRFDESSDSEDDIPEEEEDLSQSTYLKKPPRSRSPHIHPRRDKPIKPLIDRGKRKLSGHRLSQSMGTFATQRTTPTRHIMKPERSHSQDSDSNESGQSNPRDAPVMSRLLTAEAELPADVKSTTVKSAPQVPSSSTDEKSSPANLLATRLMEIFGFDRPENVVAEYPCWLLQSVLLQGFLYLTEKHICFYAYLPKKSRTIMQTGYLWKRGRNNNKYKRYWFILKGDVLSYYSNPTDLYFPQGTIDLRYGISASPSSETETPQDGNDFTIATDLRAYHFRADTPQSASAWLKSLQKTIFRSHNDGDSVKISLPITNVIDVEASPVVEYAETIKIRIVESGDTYAIDEYFFTFFNHGEDALRLLSNLTRDSPAQLISNDLQLTDINDKTIEKSRKPGDTRVEHNRRSSEPFLSPIKATVSPMPADEGRRSPLLDAGFGHTSRSPVRSSSGHRVGDFTRASFDRGRRSGSTSRLDHAEGELGTQSPPRKRNDSSVSFVQSIDKETDSSTAPLSAREEAQMSASQILVRSDVFHPQKPTRMETIRSASPEPSRRSSNDNTIQSDSPVHEDKRTDSASKRPGQSTRIRKSAGREDLSNIEPEPGRESLLRTSSSPMIHDIVKVGAYPLQQANALAGYLKTRSSKMKKLLATESMTYIEKVHGMWTGGRRHYGENEGVVPDDRGIDPEDEEANVGHGDRFRAHFALPATERLQATYFGYIIRVLPLYGKIYISNRKFCFRSLLPGTKTKLVLPLKDIENVDKEKGFRFGYHGLVLVIRGHEELFFEFNNAENRDDCTGTLLQNLESIKYMAESGLLAKQDEQEAEAARAEHRKLQEARKSSSIDTTDTVLPRTMHAIFSHDDTPAILFDDDKSMKINMKPSEPLRITCLTIGSRGDVQPYIALCKGLVAEGHKPKIATHAEFGPWVKSYGIEFAPVEGDPAELMRICIENGMFTYSFLKEASAKFRGWIDELLVSAWHACQDADVLIESPSAMAGIHIAEALNIPYFRAFTMPWTRTRAYPHAFAVPEHKIGGAYNYYSYVMFDNVFWKATAGQINRWRKKELGLRSTNLDKMQPNKVPFLYNFSPSVVPAPLDFPDWVQVTGFWFLDEANSWTPPEDMLSFIKKARDDGKKLVYIGFGSIVVSDPAALTQTVVDSVLKADVRCILAKGWSDRLGDPAALKAEVPLPSDIHQIKSAPHDWLFRQVDACVHHGGAGTTGASLRAGKPTVIKPFFGDQFFFGSRVEDLGVGICLKKVNVSVFSRALWEVTHSERMIVKARIIGERIREENGVDTAVQAIYRDLDYARGLVKARAAIEQPPVDAAAQEIDQDDYDESESSLRTRNFGIDNELEESWTFIDRAADYQKMRTEFDHAMGRSQRYAVSPVSTAAVPKTRGSLELPNVLETMPDRPAAVVSTTREAKEPKATKQSQQSHTQRRSQIASSIAPANAATTTSMRKIATTTTAATNMDSSTNQISTLPKQHERKPSRSKQ